MISPISSAPSFDHSRSSTHSTASGWSVVTPRLDVVGLPTIVSGTNIDEHWENVDDELLGAGQKPWWEQVGLLMGLSFELRLDH
jgi:hypothetical protein